MTGSLGAEGRTIRESLRLERETGADSIPPIERVYPQAASGAYLCVWPGCKFARRDPAAMWRHVHGPSHAEARDAIRTGWVEDNVARP